MNQLPTPVTREQGIELLQQLVNDCLRQDFSLTKRRVPRQAFAAVELSVDRRRLRPSLAVLYSLMLCLRIRDEYPERWESITTHFLQRIRAKHFPTLNFQFLDTALRQVLESDSPRVTCARIAAEQYRQGDESMLALMIAFGIFQKMFDPVVRAFFLDIFILA